MPFSAADTEISTDATAVQNITVVKQTLEQDHLKYFLYVHIFMHNLNFKKTLKHTFHSKC